MWSIRRSSESCWRARLLPLNSCWTCSTQWAATARPPCSTVSGRSSPCWRSSSLGSSGLGLPAAALAYALGFASVAGLSSAALRGKVPRVSGSQAVGRGLLVRRGVRLLGLNLGQALTFRLDHFVVGAVVGPMALGQLSVAAAHAAPSQVCSNSIGQVAFREAAQNRFDRTKALSMCLAAVVLASGSAIVLWCITPWLVPLIFGPAFANSVPLVRVLVIGQITSAPYLVLSKALAGQGRVRTSSWGGAAFLVVLLLALVVLTPAFGVMGAAWAGVIASSVMSAAMLAAGLLTGPWGRDGGRRWT